MFARFDRHLLRIAEAEGRRRYRLAHDVVIPSTHCETYPNLSAETRESSLDFPRQHYGI